MVALKEPPWDVGDEIVHYIDFLNAAGAAANPTEVVLQIGRKNGEVLHTFKKSLGDLDNPTPGRWEKHYVIEETGLQFAWTATGVVTIRRQGTIQTQAPVLPLPA